jgi:chromosome segregation ATPase
VITQNANKRKVEEAKLEQERAAIEQKKAQIVELERKLEAKRSKLQEKRTELERHKKFNKFLEDVVNDSGDNKEFQDIDELQNRFKNLKSENQKLMKRVTTYSSSSCCVEVADQQGDGGGQGQGENDAYFPPKHSLRDAAQDAKPPV